MESLLRHSLYTLYQKSDKEDEKKESIERAGKVDAVTFRNRGERSSDEAMQKVSCFVAITMPFFLHQLYCINADIRAEFLPQAHHDVLMPKEDYKWRENDRPPAGAADAINLTIIKIQKIEALAKSDLLL